MLHTRSVRLMAVVLLDVQAWERLNLQRFSVLGARTVDSLSNRIFSPTINRWMVLSQCERR